MIRTLASVWLSVALPMAAVCAPLVHAHLDEHASDHHGSRVVHAHLTPHAVPSLPGDRPRIGDHDEEAAVSLQVFVAVGAAAFELPVAVPTPVHLAAPLETAAHPPVQVVHGHDPPSGPPLPSRAPPSFLS